jgi:glycosyltransferase involved in cell wall biosynthesis
MWRDLGPIYDVERLRAAYSAADVFAIPSLQDNLPNTILESMACGTPVVAFATGGITEAVSDGHTGLLAPTGDVSAYSLRLRRILEDGRLRHDLGVGARKRAEQDFTVELQARRYASLYQEILRAQAPAPSVHAPVLP